MAFQDIRKSRKWLSPEEIGLLSLLVFLIGGLLWLNLYLARNLPAGEWLFLRWSAARAFLLGQGEPYSREIAEGVQQLVYGRIAFSTEYRYVLSDPFYIVLLYTPLALFPKFEIARGIWMLLSEAALLFIVLFAFRLADWEPPRVLFVLLVAFGLFSFFSLNALVTASPSIMLTFLYMSVLLALRSFSDELAGALLFLAAYQWEVGSLFFVFILIFVTANRRWNVLMGFGMSLVILLVVSFLTRSGWGLPYIRAVLSNLYQGASFNLSHILSEWLPQVRFPLGNTVSALVVAMVVVESLKAVHAPFRRVLWTACLALAAAPLLGLAISTSDQIVLLPALVLIIALVWERWLRRRGIALVVIFLLALIAPFGLYLRTVVIYSPFFTQLLTVLPPVATVLGLYWMRWWVVHSPRTWADQIGFQK